MKFSRRAALAVAAGGTLAAMAGGGGYALADSGGSNTINGCYNQQNGTLRVVTSAGDCRNSEKPISWNEQGPQGLQGPQGAQGPTGPQGPKGDSGTTHLTVVSSGQQLQNNSEGSTFAQCPTGQVATGGGVNTGGHGVTYQDQPAGNIAPDKPPTGWTGGVENTSGFTTVMTVWAVCAASSP